MINSKQTLFSRQVTNVAGELRKRKLLEAARNNSLPPSMNSSASDAIYQINRFRDNSFTLPSSLPKAPPICTTGLQTQGVWGKYALANKVSSMVSRAVNKAANVVQLNIKSGKK